jgi:anti-anti-sigma factor
MSSDGSISYALRERTCVLRLQGAIRYSLGHALDVFLDRLFARDDFDDIVIDLGDTDSIDSTGLGLLAKLANQLRKRDGRKPLVFSPRGDINAVLASICLDERVVLCERPPAAAADALPPTEPSAADFARTVLEAHRVLCEMNESNRAMFQSVVDAFERESSGGGASPPVARQSVEHGH